MSKVQPIYYQPLMDSTTIALQAEIPSEKDAETVLRELNQHFHTALTAKLTPQDKQQTINTMARLLDKQWIFDLYGFAFIVGRQYQLQINTKELVAAIQSVTDADLQLLATNIFVPEKCVTVVIELER